MAYMAVTIFLTILSMSQKLPFEYRRIILSIVFRVSVLHMRPSLLAEDEAP